MNITISEFDSLGSTNTEAIELARGGAPEGLCIVARQQTAGRGRYGRNWVSEKDAGLYFSIVLRPKIEMRYLSLITLMSGIAVHEMIREYGVKPDIKWVNDILVDEKKISGILAEAAETETGLALIVGVGLNLTSASFPPEIAETATSIEQLTGLKLTPNEAALSLSRSISHYYEMLLGPGGHMEIVDEWRSRSTYFAGKKVRVLTGNESIVGTTDGLEPNGALRVIRADGDVAVIQAGDVERLRAESAS